MRYLLMLAAAFILGCGSSDDRKDPDGFPLQPDDPNPPPAEETEIEASSQYYGFDHIDRLLTKRILDPEAEVQRRTVLAGHVSPQLISLLGRATGHGVESTFSNGNPNSLNLLLWYVGFRGLGGDFSTVCVDVWEEPTQAERAAQIRQTMLPETLDAIESLCKWNDEDFDRELAMQKFWSILVNYDAPGSEFAAWQIYFTSDPFVDMPATDAIEAMTIGALYNPYFLLKR